MNYIFDGTWTFFPKFRSNDDRSILIDEQNHCFLEKEKSKKIFSRILKIFFILEFEKKSPTFFSAKNIFMTFYFGGKVFIDLIMTLDIFLNTHTQFFQKIRK